MGLRDDGLAAICCDANNAATRIGLPERPVLFGQNAFRPLQVAADKLEIFLRDGETVDRISCHLSLPGLCVLEPVAPRDRNRAALSSCPASGVFGLGA